MLGIGSPWVLLLFGKSYQHAAPLLVWMALAAPFVSLNKVFFSRMQVVRDLKQLLSLSLLSTVIFLLVFSLFVERWALTTVGIGWLVSQIMLSLMCFGFQRKGKAA